MKSQVISNNLDKNIPIKLNGADLTANVKGFSFFNGLQKSFSFG